MNSANLNRFLEAQKHTFDTACKEVKAGRKQSHWMWFIFPQIRGLGYSEMANRYGIANLKEAEDYLNHPVLGERLISISKLLLEIKGKSAYEIFGSPDDMKLRSSMTLFASVANADPVFQQVLNIYFSGEKDERTIALLALS
ncbi:MAG: hypothetical protein K0S09_1030 [Sphingobacteriaceae bacterium]|jgi:uncharacterized protein (DUF1810 family)|nr:hypothetical protein [Sphingobacteriaceae bacterium]